MFTREACLSLTDWLKSQAGDLNRFIEELTLDENTPAPPMVRHILTPFRDEEASRNQSPPGYPALYINPGAAVDAEGEAATAFIDAESVVIVARYVTDQGGEGGDLVRAGNDAALTMRAFNRSVSAFLAQNAEADAARCRDGIGIIACTRRTFDFIAEDVGQAMAAAATVLVFYARDLSPT